MDDSVPKTEEYDDRPYSPLALILGLSPDNCSTLINIIEESQGDSAEALLIFLSSIFREGLEITIENFEIILGLIKQINYAVEQKGVEYQRPLSIEEIKEIIDAEHDIAPEEEWRDPESFIDIPEGDPDDLSRFRNLETEVISQILSRP
jgi:hypothetical protein